MDARELEAETHLRISRLVSAAHGGAGECFLTDFMDYGIWTNYFRKLPSTEERINIMRSLGFTAAELSDEDGAELLRRGNAEKTGSMLKSYCSNIGFSLPQGHLKLNINICIDDYLSAVDELKKWLDLFINSGIKNCVLHSGNIPGLAPEELLFRRTRVLGNLCGYIKDTDAYICLENLIESVKTEAELEKIINAVGSPHLAVCLDTGHLRLSGGDQYSFIKAAGEKLRALHIADNDGSYDWHVLPYGRGSVDWEGVIKGLREIKYDGLLNFEIPGESNAPDELLGPKLIYTKAIAEYFAKRIKTI